MFGEPELLQHVPATLSPSIFRQDIEHAILRITSVNVAIIILMISSSSSSSTGVAARRSASRPSLETHHIAAPATIPSSSSSSSWPSSSSYCIILSTTQMDIACSSCSSSSSNDADTHRVTPHDHGRHHHHILGAAGDPQRDLQRVQSLVSRVAWELSRKSSLRDKVHERSGQNHPQGRSRLPPDAPTLLASPVHASVSSGRTWRCDVLIKSLSGLTLQPPSQTCARHCRCLGIVRLVIQQPSVL